MNLQSVIAWCQKWFTWESSRIDDVNKMLLANNLQLASIQGTVNRMSAEFDKLKADVTTLQGQAQSNADALVVAQTDIGTLKAQIAAGSTDTQGMTDLATSVESTLASIAKELPAPTPSPATPSTPATPAAS